MAVPLFNFSGLASGLDTNAIVESLIQLERLPINRLQVQRATYNGKLDAWTAITAKLTEFRTTTDAVSSSTDFAKFVGVTSSNEDALGVEVTGSPIPSSLTFSVIQLAATHQIATGSGFAATSDLVGTDTFSITTAAGQTDLSTDSSTTLLELAQQINSADIGVQATLVEVNENDFQLLLTAEDSGTDAAFTMSTALGSFAVQVEISTGQDAILRVGDPINGLDVTRSTNVFTNVVDGVTLDLKQVTAGAVTVEIARDTDSAVTAVTAMIDAANALLAELESQTSYDAESDTASALTNDSTARGMILDLRASLSSVVSGTGSISHLGEIGIEFERDGTYSVDSLKLKDALDTNFDDVVSFLARSGSATDPLATYLSVTGETLSGTYAISITAAADVPTIVGNAYVIPSIFEDMNILLGTTSVLVGVSAGSTLSQAVTELNTALGTLGLTEILVDEFSGALRLTAPGFYGASYNMAVWNDSAFGLDNVVTGVDVAGTIDGQAATGTGRTLLSTAGDPTGLSLSISATPTDVGAGPLSLGNVDVLQGLGGAVDTWLDRVQGVDGQIARARGEWDTRIETVDDSIDAFELRIIAREARLRREFTAMESALARLQNQSHFFAGLFAQDTN